MASRGQTELRGKYPFSVSISQVKTQEFVYISTNSTYDINIYSMCKYLLLEHLDVRSAGRITSHKDGEINVHQKKRKKNNNK